MSPERGRTHLAIQDRQLVFDLSGAPNYDADDFLVSDSNVDAFRLIEAWPAWPAQALILIGAPGAGKSHLAAIWAARAKAFRITDGGSTGLSALGQHPAVLIEDCDRASLPEAAFFHLINTIKERDGYLVLTARSHPDQWELRTPDLLSRLRLCPCAVLGVPSSSLIRAVIVKLFMERQILIDEDVVAFATLHLDQSLDSVRRFVQAADEASLSAGRRISRPLAATVIERLRAAEGENANEQVSDDQGPT